MWRLLERDASSSRDSQLTRSGTKRMDEAATTTERGEEEEEEARELTRAMYDRMVGCWLSK